MRRRHVAERRGSRRRADLTLPLQPNAVETGGVVHRAQRDDDDPIDLRLCAVDVTGRRRCRRKISRWDDRVRVILHAECVGNN